MGEPDRDKKQAYANARQRTAPSPIFGVGATVERTDEAKEQKKWAGETLMSGLEKGLELSSDFLSKVHSSEPDTPLAKVAREVLVDAVKEEAWDMVEDYVPYGKAIHIAVELSEAFADGVGEALTEVNEKLNKEYEQPIMESGEVTEQDKELILNMCRYQARAVQELPGILERGMEKVKDKAIDICKKKLVGLAGGVVKDLCGQVAKQLLKQNDLFAACSELVSSASEKIPDGRKEVYGLTFHFVSNVFVDQFGSEKLKKDLKPVLSASVSKQPIDVAILSGIIQILVNKSFEKYSKAVKLDEATEEVQRALLDQANKVMARLTNDGKKIESSNGTRVELNDDKVAIPADVLQQMNGRGPVSEEAHSRFTDRAQQFRKMIVGYQVMLMAKQRHFLFELAHNRGDRDKFADELREAQNTARERAVNARKKVLEQFGPEFNGAKTVDSFAINLPPASWPIGGSNSSLDGMIWPRSIPQDYGNGYLVLK